jgi:hypothetical protein
MVVVSISKNTLLTSGLLKMTIKLQLGVYSSMTDVKVGVLITKLSILAWILLLSKINTYR